jgi:hypothetical protein
MKFTTPPHQKAVDTTTYISAKQCLDSSLAMLRSNLKRSTSLHKKNPSYAQPTKAFINSISNRHVKNKVIHQRSTQK